MKQPCSFIILTLPFRCPLRWPQRLKIFASNTPALIERLQKEKAAAAAKGTNGGVNELQVFTDENASTSGPPRRAHRDRWGSGQSGGIRWSAWARRAWSRVRG